MSGAGDQFYAGGVGWVGSNCYVQPDLGAFKEAGTGAGVVKHVRAPPHCDAYP
jgi:hypothetical protein